MKRSNIRYGNFWVRMICCVAVAVAVGNLVFFRMLTAWEAVAREMLLGATAASPVSERISMLILFVVCMIPAGMRIERPITLVGFGVLFGVIYLGVVLLVDPLLGVVLPVSAPMLGIFGVTGVLETMAWSEEWVKRQNLEQLEAAKQQFTDMLVHDLRREVASLLMAFNVLKKHVPVGQSNVGEIANTIHVTGERVLTQINDLLDIRKIEEGRMQLQDETINLGDLVAERVRAHEAAAQLLGVRLRMECTGEIRVSVDANVFSRVVSNLVWNALHHAPEGTDICVGCESVGDGSVRVRVSNRGQPIPADQRDAVFDAFVSGTASASSVMIPATGLGLAFCRLVMDAHGGVIQLESPCAETGDGVRVGVTIPPQRVL